MAAPSFGVAVGLRCGQSELRSPETEGAPEATTAAARMEPADAPAQVEEVFVPSQWDGVVRDERGIHLSREQDD